MCSVLACEPLEGRGQLQNSAQCTYLLNDVDFSLKRVKQLTLTLRGRNKVGRNNRVAESGFPFEQKSPHDMESHGSVRSVCAEPIHSCLMCDLSLSHLHLSPGPQDSLLSLLLLIPDNVFPASQPHPFPPLVRILQCHPTLLR